MPFSWGAGGGWGMRGMGEAGGDEGDGGTMWQSWRLPYSFAAAFSFPPAWTWEVSVPPAGSPCRAASSPPARSSRQTTSTEPATPPGGVARLRGHRRDCPSLVSACAAPVGWPRAHLGQCCHTGALRTPHSCWAWSGQRHGRAPTPGEQTEVFECRSVYLLHDWNPNFLCLEKDK